MNVLYFQRNIYSLFIFGINSICSITFFNNNIVMLMLHLSLLSASGGFVFIFIKWRVKVLIKFNHVTVYRQLLRKLGDLYSKYVLNMTNGLEFAKMCQLSVG